ncbi:FadR/GntR family transcriptional regulator [Cellulomonas fimi]|uniref:FadR family transcriptional regulator n=1 Tax=Cellulomonas fimi TaxID=1708 RepID=A0A7Y0LWP0_CELFI|nr:FCD domain-containing protein [Cellulomonas fimi]NMR19204.1 FadR family transcriptional regulator [Cellulomonas fimi]
MNEDPRERALLALIADLQPVGAREISKRLDGPLEGLSESTLSRLLRRLDARGLTHSPGGKGRILTGDGRAAADRFANELRWSQELGSLELRTAQDVADLLHARRGVEREIARAAALAATDADVANLSALLVGHESSIETDDERRRKAVDFHRALAEMVPNRMLRGLASVVFDPRFDHLEQVLDVITESRGTTRRSTHEHHDLLDAIESRDPDAAEAAMVRHLDRLIGDATIDVTPSMQEAIAVFLLAGRAVPAG